MCVLLSCESVLNMKLWVHECEQEHWGLVVFRERILLLDEEQCDQDKLIYAASFVYHELAHQWIGVCMFMCVCLCVHVYVCV
jgi:hypothetical protein